VAEVYNYSVRILQFRNEDLPQTYHPLSILDHEDYDSRNLRNVGTHIPDKTMHPRKEKSAYLPVIKRKISRNALFWIITGSRIEFLDFRPLKMGPTRCPETSVRNYHYTLCIRLEERSSHLLRGGSLKSRNLKYSSS